MPGSPRREEGNGGEEARLDIPLLTSAYPRHSRLGICSALVRDSYETHNFCTYGICGKKYTNEPRFFWHPLLTDS